MSVIIKNTLILTQDDKRRRIKGDIYIEDNIIREVSAKPIDVEADFKIDGRGKVTIPGLINLHTHIPMTLLRGYGDDMVLEEWLRNRIWPVERKLDRDSISAGTDLGLLEMISTGTTSFADMYFFEDTIAERTRKAGLRGFLGFSFLDFGTPEYRFDELFPRCEDFVRRWRDDGLITPTIAPHSTYTCSPETLERCADIADRHDLLIQVHCSETQHEVHDVWRRYKARPLEVLRKAGLLNDRTILAHCGWITKGEVREIARHGASISHNPVSNMKLATGGFTPLPELFKEGVNVGIGTDGPASNNTLDMFESMKFVALLHKHHRWDPCVAKAQEVLDMATIHGAKALHAFDRIGSIEEGKLADLVVIDFKKPHLTPCYDVVSHLIYACRSLDVYATIVDGRVLMLGDDFLTLDKDEVMERSRREAERLTGEIGCWGSSVSSSPSC